MTITLIQARDARPGMLLPTVGGKSAIRNIWHTTDRRGNDRINIAFANGILATNLRPHEALETVKR